MVVTPFQDLSELRSSYAFWLANAEGHPADGLSGVLGGPDLLSAEPSSCDPGKCLPESTQRGINHRGKSRMPALRTSPRTAQALPPPVIGIRLVEPLPPGVVGREVIGQDPSGRWVLASKACPRTM